MSAIATYKLENVRAALTHFLLGRGAAALFGLANAVLLVRNMATADYAAYIALLGIVGIAAMLASLGLDRAVTRFVPEGALFQTSRVLGRFVWLLVGGRLVAGLLAAVVLGFFWPWIVSLFDFLNLPQIPWALVIFLLATTLSTVLATVLQALVMQKLLTQVSVTTWVGRLVWVFAVMYQQGTISLDQALWIMAVPEAVGTGILAIAAYAALQRGTAAPKLEGSECTQWPKWQEVAHIAGHTYAFEALASLPQGYFMRTIVAATLPVDMVAAYGFFSSLVDRLKTYLPIHLLYNLVEPVLVARYLDSKDGQALSRHTGFLYKVNLLVVVAALIFLLIAGQTVVGLLTAGIYVEHSWILPLLVVQVAVGSHVVAMQLVANVLKRNEILSISGLVALVVMGAFMAAVLVAAEHVFLLFASLVYSLAMNGSALVLFARSSVPYKPPFRQAIRLTVTGVAITVIFNLAAASFGSALHPLAMIVLGCCACLMLLLLAKKCGFTNDDELGMILRFLRVKKAPGRLAGMSADRIGKNPMDVSNPAIRSTVDTADDEAVLDVPSFLRRHLTEPFVYCPNPGNAGDALMAKATYDLFERLGLPYASHEVDFVRDPQQVEGKNVVLGGGGNFTEGGYNHYAELLAAIHARAKQVVILPHTVHGNAGLLSKLQDNVTIICRERVSFQHVKKHAPKANVYLAHDMAFLLDVSSALHFDPRYIDSIAAKATAKILGNNDARRYPTLKSYLLGIGWSLRRSVLRTPRERAAFLFRTDIEKTAIPLRKDNTDASLTFNFGVTSPIKASFTVYHLLRFLESFEVIYTNRLHIAIAAGLLGKQVNFHSNSYFKCQAVYEHSLKDRFPNIRWQE